MEQMQALQKLTDVVNAIGFTLTIRILAGIAKGSHKDAMTDADYKRACDSIAETLTLAANIIAGEPA